MWVIEIWYLNGENAPMPECMELLRPAVKLRYAVIRPSGK